MRLKYAIWMVEIMMQYMKRQSSYKVHLNAISNEKLSEPLCDSVNKGLTSVKLIQPSKALKEYTIKFNTSTVVFRTMQLTRRDGTIRTKVYTDPQAWGCKVSYRDTWPWHTEVMNHYTLITKQFILFNKWLSNMYILIKKSKHKIY